MARQARSEVTRRRIIDAAVELFNEIGYPATGLGDIIERAHLTKGALYYHFDSKEALAAAIIEEGAGKLLKAFRNVADSTAPALESMIHGVFVAGNVLATDTTARIGARMLRAFGEFNDAGASTYSVWVDQMGVVVERAQAQGDVRTELDPAAVAQVVVASMIGTELISSAISGASDLVLRVSKTWEVLLPAIATAESLPYFREYLAREALRYLQPAPSTD